MAGLQKLFILLVAVGISDVVFGMSYNNVGNYDVGCYAKRREIYEAHSFYAVVNSLLPACLEGGVYRNYQCTTYGCYCVYPDSGNPYGQYLVHPSYVRYLTPYCNKTAENPSDDECRAAPFHYPCNVNTARHIYNSNTRKCETVPFGCRGYESIAECQDQCEPKVYDACSFPLDEGHECDRNSLEMRYRHSTDGECVSFTYLGCGGNSNNYDTLWECQMSCVAEPDYLSVIVRVNYRDRYNVTIPEWLVSKYQFFTDENNEVSMEVFNELREYADYIEVASNQRRVLTIGGGEAPPPVIDEAELIREFSSQEDVCNQKSKTGLCRAYFPRWYFDVEQSKCFKFVFGGCSPNGNNFKLSSDCTDYCNATYVPTPEEEASPPRDESGNYIFGFDRRNKGSTIEHGVVIFQNGLQEPTTTTEPEGST